MDPTPVYQLLPCTHRAVAIPAIPGMPNKQILQNGPFSWLSIEKFQLTEALATPVICADLFTGGRAGWAVEDINHPILGQGS